MENIFVIYGEDQYTINKELNKIITTNQIVDVIKYDMATSSITDAVIDAAMISLLNDKKMIVCEDSLFLTGSKKETDDSEEEPTEKSSQNIDELIKYLNHPNENSILVFTVNNAKLDDRKKVVKLLKDKAKIISCSKPTGQDIITFATNIFKDNHYQIDNDTIKYLLSRTGTNLNNINNEIDKLLLYRLEEKLITKEDIDDLVYKQIDDDVFALIDNLVNNNKDKSFEIYNELIIKGEEPIKILVMLANQFRLIYQVKELSSQGRTEKEIADHLKIHPYRIKLAKEKTYKFTGKQLKNYLEQLADLDYQIKNGKIDKYLGLEMFFLRI